MPQLATPQSYQLNLQPFVPGAPIGYQYIAQALGSLPATIMDSYSKARQIGQQQMQMQMQKKLMDQMSTPADPNNPSPWAYEIGADGRVSARMKNAWELQLEQQRLGLGDQRLANMKTAEEIAQQKAGSGSAGGTYNFLLNHVGRKASDVPGLTSGTAAGDASGALPEADPSSDAPPATTLTAPPPAPVPNGQVRPLSAVTFALPQESAPYYDPAPLSTVTPNQL